MTMAPVAGSVADPLEDQPSVEAAEVVGIGQPHVDDGETARHEVGGERAERGSLRLP